MADPFTPQSSINQQNLMAQMLIAQALRPQNAQSRFSPLASAAQGLAGGFLGAKSLQAQQRNQQARQDFLANLPQGGDLASALLGSDIPEFQDAGLRALLKPAGANDVFGTPIFGTDEQGNNVLGVIGKDGTFRKLDTGSVTPTPGVVFQNLGTSVQPFSTKTGLPVARPTPKAGPVEPGFEPAPSGGVQPVLGSEAEAKRQESVAAGDKRTRQAAEQASTVLDVLEDAESIIKNSDLPASGTFSRPLAFFSETNAGRLRSVLAPLRSGVAVGALQRLKEASATGATGFGQLNKSELELLLGEIGSLDPDTTAPDILLSTLARARGRFSRVLDDIKRNVSPERIRELGLEPLLGTPSDSGSPPVDTPVAQGGVQQSQGPLPFEPDANRRQIGQVYNLPDGRQALWTSDGQSVGWELLN